MPGLHGPRTRPAPKARGIKPQVERLEDRTLLAADIGADPFAELISHGGLCSCPICSGQGIEAFAPQQATAVTGASSAWVAGSSPAGLPALNSRFGARATLFLDFNGHVESRWGERTNLVTPAYDIDGNYSNFNAQEVANIREIWARVAEDYAPFNINVTTVQPTSFADKAAVRMAIGGNYSDWFGNSAGGVAYIGGFYNGAPNVGYVFEDALGNGNAKYVAEAASHEAGHLFGLSHQADWNGATLVTEYDAGNAALAPIMGVGYYSDRTTWTSGLTDAGPTSRQDDLSILSGSLNGFGYVADDHGNTTAAASLLPTSGSSINVSGLIGRNDDRDVFKFTTGGGQVSFMLNTATVGANLDGVLELLNSAGAVLTTANPAASYGATLARTLAAGTYYVVVRSSGGYGNLGQYTLRGAASLTSGTQQPAPQTSLPEISVTVNGVNLVDGGALSFGSTTRNVAVTRIVTIKNTGGGTLNLTPLSTTLPAGYSLVSNITSTRLTAGQSTSFTIRLNATQAGSFAGGIALASSDANESPFNLMLSGYVGQVASSPVPTSSQILDNGSAGFTTSGAWQTTTGSGNGSDTHWIASGATTSSATWNFMGLAPGQYRLAATWPASRMYATDAPFSIRAGTQLLGTVRVNQQRAAATFSDAGASWQNLGTFTISGNTLSVRLNGSTTGRVVADAIRLERVYSTSGGTAFRNAAAGDELAAASVFATTLAPSQSRSAHESPAAALAAIDALFASQQALPSQDDLDILPAPDQTLASIDNDRSELAADAADEWFALLDPMELA
jgi:hypothetical protein